jgi:hypothetical protein
MAHNKLRRTLDVCCTNNSGEGKEEDEEFGEHGEVIGLDEGGEGECS